jgi:hypothetical protein
MQWNIAAPASKSISTAQSARVPLYQIAANPNLDLQRITRLRQADKQKRLTLAAVRRYVQLRV